MCCTGGCENDQECAPASKVNLSWPFQQVEGGDSSPSAYTAEATPGVLYPTPVHENHKHTAESSSKGHGVAKALEHLSHKQGLVKLGVLSLESERLRDIEEDRDRLFAEVPSDKSRGNGYKLNQQFPSGQQQTLFYLKS